MRAVLGRDHRVKEGTVPSFKDFHIRLAICPRRVERFTREWIWTNSEGFPYSCTLQVWMRRAILHLTVISWRGSITLNEERVWRPGTNGHSNAGSNRRRKCRSSDRSRRLSPRG